MLLISNGDPFTRYTIYIYIVLKSFVHSPYFFALVVGSGAQQPMQKSILTGRAGGARADDNFTKKPQKKLIRYMVVFWGSNTSC